MQLPRRFDLIRVETPERKRVMKMAQRHYWGSKQWRLSYAMRTYVESWFGVLKHTTSTGFHRGSHQFKGLPLVTLVVAVAAATTNLRLLRTWNEETGLGDVTHPLFRPDVPPKGNIELNPDSAKRIKTAASKRFAYSSTCVDNLTAKKKPVHSLV